MRNSRWAGLALLLWPAMAVAQADRQSFDPAYFERFAPQTAIDMLRQVPGFSIRSTGGGRGLGQGGANVLINGARVTSKDTSAVDILEQTPAQTVLRIEVTDAASLGVTGLNGQVANVVIDRSRLSGSFEWRPFFRRGGKPRLTAAKASLAGQRGGVDFTVGVDSQAWRGFEAGPERRLDQDRLVLDERFEKLTVRRDRPVLTVAVNAPLNPRTSLALTGSASVFSLEQTELSVGQGDTRVTLDSEDEWTADLSAELTRQMGPGALKLIGYQRYETGPTLNRSRTFTPPLLESLRAFAQDTAEGETIARAEYAWQRSGGPTWEVAAETALNFLEVEASLTEDLGAGPTTERLPTRRVEELRHQASLTRGFNLGDKLTLQGSLAAEWSRISVEDGAGVTQQEQELFRPKGLVSMAYSWSPSIDVRGRFERRVGQLSFSEFIDAVDLTEDRDFAGNTGLVPQQSWELELESEKRFGADEKIIVRVVSGLVEDRVERVLIDGRDAVGNVDGAWFVRFQTEGTVLLDRFSIPGGRFDFDVIRRRTSIEDPITLEERRFSNVQDWSFELDFRQDIRATPFAWGLAADGRGDLTTWRFNEVVVASQSGPDYEAFFEHKDFFGLNLRVSGRNLSNLDDVLTRQRFAGIRPDAMIDVIERRSRASNRRFHVALSGTF